MFTLHSSSSTTLRLGLGNEFIEFKHVMKPFPNPVLITTADAKIIYANPAWEKLTGYTLQEVQGKNPNILKSKKTDRRIYKSMWETLLAGKVFTTEDMINVAKDGKEFQVNSTIFPIYKDRNILFFVQVEEDITTRKKLDELKRQFLHAATHELKTPITALKLFLQSQLLRSLKRRDDSDVVQSLRLVDNELDRLTRLINELSDVTRIESGKLKMDLRIIDITQLIQEVIMQMSVLGKEHTIHFYKPQPIMVLADADRIKQVIINLLNNAIKYSMNGSDIHLQVTTDTKHAIVLVRDSGVGIDPEKLPRIFDQYYQVEKEKQVGLGLGLYIAKEIIHLHKGKIWAISQKGKGSTFFFTLKRIQ